MCIRDRYNGVLYWQPMGTYHHPTQQYHCRPARGTPSRKWASQNVKHRPCCGVFLLSWYCNTFSWHVAVNDLVLSARVLHTACVQLPLFAVCLLVTEELIYHFSVVLVSWFARKCVIIVYVYVYLVVFVVFFIFCSISFSGVFRGGALAPGPPPFQPTIIFMMVLLAVLLIFFF